jgi:hypothetical protein
LVFLVIGSLGMLLYVCMGRFKIIVHYAGWGRGPGEDAYVPVTGTVQAFIDGNTPDVKVSDIYFGKHYPGEPRQLKVVYSRGRVGARKTAVIPEHHVLRLP